MPFSYKNLFVVVPTCLVLAACDPASLALVAVTARVAGEEIKRQERAELERDQELALARKSARKKEEESYHLDLEMNELSTATLEKLVCDKGSEIADCDEYLEQRNLTTIQRAEAYFTRGWIRSSERDDNGALSDYTEAIGLQTDKTRLVDYHLHRAEIYQDIGSYRSAILDYEQVEKILPNDRFALGQQAYIFEHRIRDYSKAVAVYTRYLDNDNDPGMRLQRARLYFKDRKFKEALEDFEIVESQNQTLDRSDRFWRGRTCLELERFGCAYDDMASVVKSDPEDASAHLYLANASEGLERWEEALTSYEEAANIGDENIKEMAIEGVKRVRLYFDSTIEL